jgi:hypothetical protein
MNDRNDEPSTYRVRDALKATFARYGVKEEDVFTDSDSKSTTELEFTSNSATANYTQVILLILTIYRTSIVKLLQNYHPLNIIKRLINSH